MPNLHIPFNELDMRTEEALDMQEKRMPRLGDIEERTLTYLIDHPGSGPREIADATGEPLQRIRLALQKLRDAGLVTRGDEGHYYAVIPAIHGFQRREVRNQTVYISRRDIDFILKRLDFLEKRIEKIELLVRQLLTRCHEANSNANPCAPCAEL